ncbi:hypothetical protein Vadar_014712 [Vaccinium darrowii]|uniref:Uncharacterized protein n=1 Tax=Vaccinium darrowii TaxID=229202 RepID=A0ACB7YDH7_9ERIC|nr:hypothetical protein Vadar_014712 [Vaccinium darrowii]
MNSAELSLDLSSIYGTPKPISELLKKSSLISEISQKSSNLDYYLKLLEDELRKIDGLKRELPLSMLLLTDAIERLKEERMKRERSKEGQLVTEELIQLMGNSDENGRRAGGGLSSDSSDKRNWMSSAKLWTATTAKCENCNKNVSEFSLKSGETTEDGSATKTRYLPCNFKNRGGSFVPFEGTSGLATMKEAAKVGSQEQGVLILKPVAENGSIDLDFEGNSKHSDSSSVTEQMKPQIKFKPHLQQQFKQQKKKHRRCWSPELHRRFVDALGLLGGPQTATPKHIKQLMQVDTLTNDEVKSHLQKYRIHVLKQQDSSTATSN